MHKPVFTLSSMPVRAGRTRTAVILAALMAALNYLIWSWVGVPTLGTDVAVKAAEHHRTARNTSHSIAPDVPAYLNGITYAPYTRSDAPGGQHAPAALTMAQDLAQLSTITKNVRTYSAAQFPDLPTLAGQFDLHITLGAWLNRDYESNQREINAALALAAKHDHVKRLIIGNETVLKKQLTPVQLIEILKRVRTQTKLPVSTAEPWHVWIQHPELASHVDFITIHLLPYWEGVGIATAVEESFERLARVRARFPGKTIVIGEVGYPSRGDTIQRAEPSPSAQATFVRQFVARAATEKLDYFLIEAYDQPWKQAEEGRAGGYWGVFDAARQPKYSFAGPVVSDPYWRAKAVGSSVAGFAVLVWFLTRFATLSQLARIAFAATAQGFVSVTTVVITLPLLHYMRMGDWIMLALLVPTSILMVAILLAHLLEFVELFFKGSLRRSFQPMATVDGGSEPFVSVHLACCNEPPDMVIATIKSLAALHYRAFEVIVIDNNTADPTLWKPVRDYVATLPVKFRFIHLPQWSGYKAGALNYALSTTDPRTEIVAVVDADYVVKPEWLGSLVGYFADPKVGIVQAPQAHRDWGTNVFRKMMNWEYEGFFRIGMHHRNERDAIIQHGTMTLIRASALQQHGQWSEWCLCEDTELGLRLMQQDLRTVYVDIVMGEGLTPDSFAAFKKQRQRWAQGGMQIFKAHWRALLGQSRLSNLSLAQRYHFLAGWLPWVGDLLHGVFVLAGLIWTVGYLVRPQQFSLPIALFMLPLGVFVATKLVMGPLLYWRRVPCSVGGIVGAAIAGMGLSHAIARGVLAGLVHKTGVFQITSKGKTASNAFRAMFVAVREELLLFFALLLCIIAVGLARSAGHVESALWMAILALQALPYLASIACAIAAGLPEKKSASRTSNLRLNAP